MLMHLECRVARALGAVELRQKVLNVSTIHIAMKSLLSLSSLIYPAQINLTSAKAAVTLS